MKHCFSFCVGVCQIKASRPWKKRRRFCCATFCVGGSQQDACTRWLTGVTRALLAPIAFREAFVILALFLPQLPFAEGAKLDGRLWSSPAIRRDDSEVQITPLAQGLQSMHECKIAFAAHSRAAAFCSPDLQNYTFEQLTSLPSEKIHIGCQVGKVYRVVLREDHTACALLVVLLEFVTQPKKKSKQRATETWEETAARQSSPRSWVVAVSMELLHSANGLLTSACLKSNQGACHLLLLSGSIDILLRLRWFWWAQGCCQCSC